MPENNDALSQEDFAQLLNEVKQTRRISSIHLHHTWKPRKTQFVGVATIEAMRNYHIGKGWDDIAQHLTIDPHGGLWVGRNWNAAPASAKGCNGGRDEGPFMIEMVGNFDEGEETLEGEQLNSVVATIARLLNFHGLSETDLVFHRDCENAWKTCPGTGVDRNDLVEKVKAARGSKKLTAAISESSQGVRALANKMAITGNDRGFLDKIPFLGGGRIDDGLVRHLVGSSDGRFDDDESWMTKAHVDEIFSKHLSEWVGKRREDGKNDHPIVLYAHGGLNSESKAVDIARHYSGWWKGNEIYPIYFIWKTGLLETIGDQIKKYALGALFGKGERGLGNWFSDKKDLFLEKSVHKVKARRVTWDDMKINAQRCFDKDGVGRYFLLKLSEFLSSSAGDGARIELVGHSAGSIFHSRFLEAFGVLTKSGEISPSQKKGMINSFGDLHLMAPAIRCDEFKAWTLPQVGSRRLINSVSLFTMTDYWERKDTLGPYGKSLLYMIHFALEDRVGEPLLGMETALRNDSELARFFNFDGNYEASFGELILSKTKSLRSGWNSQSEAHGGFDNDKDTMESIVYRILGRESSGAFPDDPDKAEKRSFSFPEIVGGNRSLSGSKTRALCVGIDEYTTQPLYGCVNDAQRWARTFGQLGADDTTLVTNGNATLQGILESFEKLARESRSGDTIWFQYAGHGSHVPDISGDEANGDSPGQDEILCPIDITDGQILLDDDIGAMIDRVAPGVRVVCIFDCCHSGTATRVFFGVRENLVVDHSASVRERYLRLDSNLRGRCVENVRRRGVQGVSRSRQANSGVREILFSACNSRQTAKEEYGNGVFTTAATTLIAQLGAGVGSVSCSELARRIHAAVDPKWDQTPELHCSSSAKLEPVPGINAIGVPIAPTSFLATEPQQASSNSVEIDMLRQIDMLTDLI